MVEDKSNEIPAARRLLERCDAEGAMVLTDALHTQTLSAREIVQDCGGDYLMTVKANQKGLLRNLHEIHSAHKVSAFPPSDGFVAAR
jgi:predicted transposase YbfD/YdcC